MKKILDVIIEKQVVFLVLFFIFCFTGLKAQSWYNTAEERIDTLRKGDFTLHITDEIGDPVTDSVYVRLKKHEFPWGNTVGPLDNSATSKWHQAALLKYYNYGVVERFKWPYIEPTEGNMNYAEVDTVYAWANRVGWDVRAHTLLWGGSQNWQMPGWSLTLQGEELYNACETHVRREVSRYKGIIGEYDVYNEPMHETWLANSAGDSIKWNSFKWAHEEDTNAHLFVNDYNIIVWGPTQPYVDTIQSWIDHGAPVTGIGVQSHMEGTINWSDVKSRLDVVAQLGLPVKVTEFDMKIDEQNIGEQSMASAYGMMMRTCFSHPAIEGFIWWGYIDPVYRNGSGIFSEDKRPKIAADTVYQLLHEKWSTRFKALPEADGTLPFHGFYGDYEIGIKVGDEYRVVPASCRRADDGTEVSVSLVDAVAEPPVLLFADHNTDGSVISLHFDKVMNAPAADLASFVVFAPKSVSSINLNSVDSSIIELHLTTMLNAGTYYCVVYTPGTITSVNGGILPITGPESVPNKIPGYIAAETSPEGDAVLLSLSAPMANPATSISDFEITVNNQITSITSIDYQASTDSVFKLLMELPVTSPVDVIKISYARGNLESLEGFLLDNFNAKAVENRLPSAVEDLTGNNFRVFPNPFNEELSIESDGERNFSELKIFDITGRKVIDIHSGNLTECVINTAGLERGMYTLRLLKDGEVIAVRKVSKQ